jgi:hypothetical protein
LNSGGRVHLFAVIAREVESNYSAFTLSRSA